MSDELKSTPQEVSEWVARKLDGEMVEIGDAHLAIQQFIPDLLERVEELENTALELSKQVRTVEGWRRELEAENERLRALDEAIDYVRSQYPEDIWIPGGNSLDAKSADMARRTCDNIRYDAKRIQEGHSIQPTS